jgi:hypothetical protein
MWVLLFYFVKILLGEPEIGRNGSFGSVGVDFLFLVLFSLLLLFFAFAFITWLTGNWLCLFLTGWLGLGLLLGLVIEMGFLLLLNWQGSFLNLLFL